MFCQSVMASAIFFAVARWGAATDANGLNKQVRCWLQTPKIGRGGEGRDGVKSADNGGQSLPPPP